MKLNLKKPLVVFDLEATGLDLVRDRIIQISYIKISPNGEEKRRSIYVNPGMPINTLVQELTGITNERVQNEKSFKEIAKDLAADFTGCDFAGFNSNRFDVPLLSEEFSRAGVDFDFTKCRLIDAQTIFHKREPRNLAAAYRFYTGHKMEEDFVAHRADQDAEATYRVLMGQLDKYSPEIVEEPSMALTNDMDVLAAESKMNDNVDFAGRMVWQNMKDKEGNVITDKDGTPKRQEIFNFGKYKGWVVTDVLHRDPHYFDWIMSNDFTLNTKQTLTRIKLREAKLNMNSVNTAGK